MNEGSQSESEVKEDDDLGLDSVRCALPKQQSVKKKKNRRKNRPKKTVAKSSEADEDEVERSVKEVNRLLGEAKAPAGLPSAAAAAKVAKTLLSVEYKHLNPEMEMKRMFGSRVVELENQRPAHHRRGGGRNRGVRHRAPIKSAFHLVVPKPGWPSPGKTGLSMKYVETDEAGNQYFKYEHDAEYQQVQVELLQAIESHQPDFIVVS